VQLPTATVVNPGTVAVTDQAATGYFDIGTMRLQWGAFSDLNVDPATVTLPALFLNANYVVTLTCSSAAGSAAARTQTTSTFQIDRASTFTTAQTWGWFAVGLKP
jgi:hypothetical protein